MKKQERPPYLAVLSYRLFGRMSSHFTFLKKAYVQSGLSRSYESYMALMFFSSLVAFFSIFVAGSLVHGILFGLPLFQSLTAVLILSCISLLIVPAIFIAYPLYRGDQRKKQIETSLVYTTGYMGVLAAGGISTERIFERVTQVEQHLPIRELASRAMANIRIFGLDVVSSLNDVILHSPSETFSKLLTSITNTLKTSGDLKNLLTFETERLLHTKKEDLKKTLNTLTAFGELYITGVVIGPIVFIVMITILSVMGNVTFGISPVMQLNLLVFFGIPALSAVCIVILNSILPEEE